MDPITMNRLAIIRQQEILAAAASDWGVPMPWRRLWHWLTARRQTATLPSMQPASVSVRMEKRNA